MTDPRATALVVDDAPTVRMYHGGLLRSLGFEVDEAANGFEALESVMSKRYDLLLVDVNMPQMDGYTLIRRLRDEPVLFSAPVITISTEARPGDVESAYRSGANFYLVKPAGPQTLHALARILTAALPSQEPLSNREDER